MTAQQRRTIRRAVGGLQVAIGTLAVLAPRQLSNLFGIDPARLNGEGILGWRLFGIRQVLLGTGNVTLDETSGRSTLAIATADLALFATTAGTRSIPLRTSLMGLTTAATVTAATLASRPPH